MMSERISIQEIIRVYEIDSQFLDELIASELLHPETENNTQYIVFEELPHLEKFTNWHYDLEINLPGIEVIHKLLNQMEELRNENRKLLQSADQFRNWEDAEF